MKKEKINPLCNTSFLAVIVIIFFNTFLLFSDISPINHQIADTEFFDNAADLIEEAELDRILRIKKSSPFLIASKINLLCLEGIQPKSGFYYSDHNKPSSKYQIWSKGTFS